MRGWQWWFIRSAKRGVGNRIAYPESPACAASSVMIFDHRMNQPTRMDQISIFFETDREKDDGLRISSSPLFNHVALVDRNLAPMSSWDVQTACSASHCHCSRVHVRKNRAALAVRVILADLIDRPPCRAWEYALCSESTGSNVAPGLFGPRQSSNAPQDTETLPYWPASAPSCRSASLKRGGNPAQPTYRSHWSSLRPWSKAASRRVFNHLAASIDVPASCCLSSS